ncbi:GTP cyclohydrolase I FolE [Hymenobacter humi]|uniref:GTP cyclohydrolase 1 n=1 Tax=Hymenobacter humi TaxID=1411620 RepID=A0ABW2U2W2_9BACT
MDNPTGLAPATDAHLPEGLRTPFATTPSTKPTKQRLRPSAAILRPSCASLGLDLSDDSLAGTPRRVAKMYVQEWFKGLDPRNRPEVRMFHNRYNYHQLLVERDITLFSCCEHHFVPIIGKAHVAYLPSASVVGLSKLNRVVQYYARRPQVQERLTRQIAEELKQSLGTDDVAVLIEADHLCVMSRGVNDTSSSTLTSEYGGQFATDHALRQEFLRQIGK